MTKKQSSIDWLVEQLIPNAMRMFDATTCNAIEQAKAMHKEEIKDAHFDGQCDKTEGYLIVIAEHYYNEIFGGEKQC